MKPVPGIECPSRSANIPTKPCFSGLGLTKGLKQKIVITLREKS